MKKLSKFVTISMLSASFLTIGTQLLSSNVKADTNVSSDTNTVSNTSVPDKSLITPVASRDNQTLRQVAKSNNVDLSVLEKLNDNIDPDKVIPNGTPLYLPQNEDLSNIFGTYLRWDSSVPSSLKSKYYNSLSPRERAAKLWIISRESGGNYNARNGIYIGRFQLKYTYLHGNYSKANQERAAARYVRNRYGSWSAAQRFWKANGWY